MRLLFLLLAGVLMASAQTPDLTKMDLRGDRFRPLKYEEMNPDQQQMIRNLLSGERGTTTGPFNTLLRTPKIGDLAQRIGAELRFHSVIPDALKEFTILIGARYYTAQYEWYAHRPLAESAGLSVDIIEALRLGRRPSKMTAQEDAVYTFATELLETHKVSDQTFAAAKKQFDEPGVVNILDLLGYYSWVSLVLNVDRYPLPAGAAPPLPVLAK